MEALTEKTLLSGPASGSPGKPVPLAVDLDGTLVKTDLLIESLFALIKRNPLYFFLLPFWLVRGRAFFKEQVCQRGGLDVSSLPYHQGLLDYLRDCRDRGRRLVLATGSDQGIAGRVADALRLFDAVFASDGKINLSGRNKRDRLLAEFGERGFDYAGDRRRDLAVWSVARRALVVNASPGLPHAAARRTEIERVFDDREGRLKCYLRAMRLHHWLKNLLVFVPLVAAHRFHDPDLLVRAFLAFLAFGWCASSVYIINDLVDLPADRRHPRKRLRPFAAGELSLLSGLASVPLLFGLSLLTGMTLPPGVLEMLLLYFLLNLGYSFTLKRIALLDVMVLAGLYTLRIMAGSAAVDVRPSSWLLALSTFLFLSLALVKRYAELVMVGASEGEKARVRGYRTIDKDLLMSLGSASGYVAVLVLAIYISSGAAKVLYERYELIWLLCPLLLFWVSYVWLVAHRGEMEDDPLVFTLGNRVSRIVLVLAAVIFALAI